MTGEFLSAGELQTLTNCSSSRRSAQIEWLQREGIPAKMANQIRAMYLRDMRKRSAALAGSLHEASELLQHDSKQLTAKHYRQDVAKLRTVR